MSIINGEIKRKSSTLCQQLVVVQTPHIDRYFSSDGLTVKSACNGSVSCFIKGGYSVELRTLKADKPLCHRSKGGESI
jgi:hypothetical protein